MGHGCVGAWSWGERPEPGLPGRAGTRAWDIRPDRGQGWARSQGAGGSILVWVSGRILALPALHHSPTVTWSPSGLESTSRHPGMSSPHLGPSPSTLRYGASFLPLDSVWHLASTPRSPPRSSVFRVQAPPPHDIICLESSPSRV